MARETDGLVLPKTGGLDQLGAIKTLLTGAKLRLTKAAIAITPDTTEAALEAQEADYTGYTATGVVLTWSAVGLSAEGRPIMASQRVRFQPTDPTTVPNTVFNGWVSGAGVLEFGFTFGTPKGLTAPTDFIDVTVYVTQSGDGVVGWADVED